METKSFLLDHDDYSQSFGEEVTSHKESICEKENLLHPNEKEEITKNFKEKINPYQDANIISKSVFYWAYKLVGLSHRIKLDEEHFGKFSEEHQSNYQLNNLKDFWNNTDYKNKENGILKAMISFNIKDLSFLIFLFLLVTTLEVTYVFFFREYVKTFGLKNDEGLKKGIIYGIIILSSRFFTEVLTRHSWFLMISTGLRTRYQLQGLTYDKLLRLAPSSRNPKFSEGKIINIVTGDCDKFKLLVHGISESIFGPLKIIIYNAMLIGYFGYSALWAFGILIICVICNYAIIKWNIATFKERNAKKDKRIQYSNETLANIKILKLYAWDRNYHKRITEVRNEELGDIKKTHLINLIDAGIFNFVSILIASTVLGTYQMLYDKMIIENVMTGMFIFNQLRTIYQNLPSVFDNIPNCIDCLKRIQDFLNLDEINPNNVIEGGSSHYDFYPVNKSTDKIIQTELSVQNNDSSQNSFSKKDTFITNNLNVHSFTNSYAEDIAIKIPNLSFSWGVTENSTKKELPKPMENNLEEMKKEEAYESDDDEDEMDVSKADYPVENNVKTTLKNIDIEIKKGQLIAIIGKTGSGKSSLIEAMLNNMLILNHNLDIDDKNYSDEKIFVNGSIAYSSQTPWIQNATLKNNILFYNELDEKKYQRVVELCELESDFAELPGGDSTEIGENGVNLSGGQKARISLARAVYSDRDIIILDDILSALDAQVGEKIMTNLICKYLKGKTRILVTHQIQYLQHFDKIIDMKNGRISWSGSFDSFKYTNLYQKLLSYLTLKEKKKEIKSLSVSFDEINQFELDEEEEDIQQFDNESISASFNTFNNMSESVLIFEPDRINNKDHKIISNEDREIGRVKFSVYLNYARYLGGYFIVFVIISIRILAQVSLTFSDKFLLVWVKTNTEETKWQNLGIYCAYGFFSFLLIYSSNALVYYKGLNCSESIHSIIIKKLIYAPVTTFHETVPLGRIINRLSNDLEAVDNDLSNRLIKLLNFFASLFGIFIICGIYFPWSFILLPFLLIVGFLIGGYSDRCNIEVNRLLQIAISPISNSTLETISGLKIIRAYGLKNYFQKRFHEKLDVHHKIHLFASAIAAWFHLTIGFISSFLLLMFLVYSLAKKDDFDKGSVALMLTYSLLFYLNVFQTLFAMRNFEIDLIKMERCLYFSKISTENKQVEEDDKDLFTGSDNDSNENLKWPKEGAIEFRNYSVKYRPDTAIVLKNLNFKINPGEKVGICGRTGSGKSTLCLSVFRILEPAIGSIFIDGVDICKIGLRTLRSSLTIIPQDPRLMKGTLRYNIDPFGFYSDQRIIEIMETLKIKYIIDNPSGLDLLITENGGNLSIGEKQLICIARALLKNSKIVVMDEATANIDFQTEQIIQNAISVLLKTSTVLTIAHRIKTIINYDKILILNRGKLKEFDSPKNLLLNPNSLFTKLVKKSELS